MAWNFEIYREMAPKKILVDNDLKFEFCFTKKPNYKAKK